MNWEPGDDYCVRWEDKTEENRTKEQLDEMVEKMRTIANEYGFDLSCYGNWKGMKIVAAGEDEIIRKHAYEISCPRCRVVNLSIRDNCENCNNPLQEKKDFLERNEI